MVAQFDRIHLATVHFHWRVIDNITVSINGGPTSNAYLSVATIRTDMGNRSNVGLIIMVVYIYW